MSMAGFAQAEIYKCTDETGVATFTDNPKSVPGKKCVGMNLAPITTVESPKKLNKSPTKAAAASPGNFPSVDAGTQSQRDSSRRKILEDELAGELQLLNKAKAEYENQANVRNGDETKNYQRYLDRITPYKDAVTAHEKNIEALKKEISRVK